MLVSEREGSLMSMFLSLCTSTTTILVRRRCLWWEYTRRHPPGVYHCTSHCRLPFSSSSLDCSSLSIMSKFISRFMPFPVIVLLVAIPPDDVDDDGGGVGGICKPNVECRTLPRSLFASSSCCAYAMASSPVRATSS